jgi:hypothetical protein
MDITYNHLKTYVRNQLFYPLINRQLSVLNSSFGEIEKTINAEDITLIYPKNLFLDNNFVEMYIFDNKEHLIMSIYKDELITSKIFCLRDITLVDSTFNLQNDARTLILKFRDGDIVELNSTRDTNSNHSRTFSELILGISRLILNSRG